MQFGRDICRVTCLWPGALHQTEPAQKYTAVAWLIAARVAEQVVALKGQQVCCNFKCVNAEKQILNFGRKT